MLNFDPRTLRSYIPPAHSFFDDAVKEIINRNAEGRIHASEDLLNSNLLSYEDYETLKTEKEDLEVNLLTGSLLMETEQLDWAWRCLWTHLIKNTIAAKSIDLRCNVYDVDAHFWTSAYATQAFFSGEIIEIPPYKPHGRLFISDREIKEIGDQYYYLSYRSIIPAAPGIVCDEEGVKDLYANSLISGAVDIISRRSGTNPTHDKEQFLIEVFALIYQYGVFKSKSELARLSSNAYANANPNNQRPSPRWAEEVVGKIWDRLGLKDTPVSELRRIRGDV